MRLYLSAIALGLIIGLIPWWCYAGVYGNRVDKTGARVRWLTQADAAQGVDFETPAGLVSCFLYTERRDDGTAGDSYLIVHAHGDDKGSTDVSLTFGAPNQARVKLVRVK